MLEDLGLRVIEEVPTRLKGGDGDTWVQDFGVLGPGDRPIDLRRARRARRRLHLGGLARRHGVRLAQPARARGGPRLAPDRDPARLPQVPPAGRLALHRELPERRAGDERGADREARAAVRAALRPRARARRGGRGGAARGDPHRPRRGRVARPRPHPAQPARADRGDAAHERLPPRPRRDGVQAALGRRAGDPRARAARRDLRLLGRDGGDPPARRPDRPRRHPLVGPHGLPHRGLRPHARAADQERPDRPRGREGRLLPQAPPGRPGRAARGGPAPVRRLRARRCSTSPTTSSTARSSTRPTRACSTATTPTSSSPPTRARRRSRTPPTSVAEDYGFWLGDAFASGGSSGYDHKKLGITARGAWESVKRHFLELELDVARDPFTVVGIGDMSGDVFGNGMLLSDRIRLVAAYDHRHIFIDPDPDPDVGVRRAAAAVRPRRLLVERLRPREDLRGRRRVAAHGQVDPAVGGGAAGARDRGRRARAQRRDPRHPARTGRPALERRHRHRGQGERRDRRRRAGPLQRRDPRGRERAALPRGGGGRQPRLHAPRAGRVHAQRRARQRGLHRQLGGRRLLRPRGQPEGPAGARRARRGAHPPRPRRAAARRHRRGGRARPLRLLPAGPDHRPGDAPLGVAARRLRGPDGRARGGGAARPRRRRRCPPARSWPSGAARGAGWSARSCRCC